MGLPDAEDFARLIRHARESGHPLMGACDLRNPCVYMLASGWNGTLYVGVTSDLVRRVWEHRSGKVDGFTKRYGVSRLVWFEMQASMTNAIGREKQIKKWRRDWKMALIENGNPHWVDLYPGLLRG